MTPYRFALLVIYAASLAACGGSGEAFTLYRSSPVDVNGRYHIATFDSADGRDYNRENCETAASLFQRQAGVIVKFWCEKGRFSK